MLRRAIFAGVAICVFGLTFGFGLEANATWFDSATGQPVQVSPRGESIRADQNETAFGGHNLYWDKECKTWRDAKTGNEVRVSPRGESIRADDNHTVFGGHNLYWVPSPCPPPTENANGLPLVPPMQSNIVPGGTMLPGKDAGGHDTPDKPGGDTKTTDTKPTDTKAPVKDDKPQRADAPKTGQAEKAVTGKDGAPSKAAAEKEIPKGTKKLTGAKNPAAHKTAKTAKSKEKKKAEEKVQVHIEFFSTRSGGGGFNSGGYGR